MSSTHGQRECTFSAVILVFVTQGVDPKIWPYRRHWKNPAYLVAGHMDSEEDRRTLGTMLRIHRFLPDERWDKYFES